MSTFSFERLILWHHDLYANRKDERRDRLEVVRFLHEVAQWYEEGYDQMSQAERDKHWTVFFSQRPILESAPSPLVAIRAYLDQQSASEEATSAD